MPNETGRFNVNEACLELTKFMISEVVPSMRDFAPYNRQDKCAETLWELRERIIAFLADVPDAPNMAELDTGRLTAIATQFRGEDMWLAQLEHFWQLKLPVLPNLVTQLLLCALFERERLQSPDDTRPILDQLARYIHELEGEVLGDKGSLYGVKKGRIRLQETRALDPQIAAIEIYVLRRLAESDGASNRKIGDEIRTRFAMPLETARKHVARLRSKKR